MNETIAPAQPASDTAHSHFFEVEKESEWLVLHVDCSPPLVTWNVYQLYDPEGRLRYQHMDVNCPRTVIIHRQPLKTSLNGVAGPITAGRWRLEFPRLPELQLYYEYGSEHLHSNFPEFRPIYPDPYRDVWVDLPEPHEATAYNRYDWDKSHQCGPRWYRGDCHMHSILSDGSLTPDQLNNQARRQGLDFICVTDHLIFPSSWPKTDLLVIPGIEVTTHPGHWNALGPRQWFDWRISAPDGGMLTETGMQRIMDDAERSGALRVLNHPRHYQFEWTFHDTRLSSLDALEIMNAPQNPDYNQGNEETITLWNTLWNDGWKIPGIAGSDFHYNAAYHLDGEECAVGDPSTYVYADCLSASSVLQAMRAGHVYVSRSAQLDISIAAGGEQFLPGDDVTRQLKTQPGEPIHYGIDVRGQDGGTLCWIENGVTVRSAPLPGDGRFEHSFHWNPDEYNWARVEIRSIQGDVVTFTNPIYCGNRTPTLQTWQQLVANAGLPLLALKGTGYLGWI